MRSYQLCKTYLRRFCGLCGDGLALSFEACAKVFAGDFAMDRDVVATTGFGAGTLYFASKSPILAFLKAIGILLTLISIRVRIPCACRLYCARIFRARSVTDTHQQLCISEREEYTLSNCRLSINACFCATVIPRLAFLIGVLLVGVFAVLDPFVGTL